MTALCPMPQHDQAAFAPRVLGQDSDARFGLTRQNGQIAWAQLSAKPA